MKASAGMARQSTANICRKPMPRAPDTALPRMKSRKEKNKMGLMDMITGSAERHPEVNQEQHVTLLQTAMQMLGNHGGISGLLSNARSQGLEGAVQSWIGTGANHSVSAEQSENLIGEDRLNQLASRAGISPE